MEYLHSRDVGDKHTRVCTESSNSGAELHALGGRRVLRVGMSLEFVCGLIGKRRTRPERDNHFLGSVLI
jgi:hypothetical protein